MTDQWKTHGACPGFPATVFVCGDGRKSLEYLWGEQLAREQALEYSAWREEYERGQSEEDAAELHRTEEDMFYSREGVDPFRPDHTTAGTHEVETEMVPIDWVEILNAR